MGRAIRILPQTEKRAGWLLDEAADAGALAAHRGRLHRLDDVVDRGFGYPDDGECLGDPDRADVPTDQARLVGDRTDEVARPHPGLAAEADVDEPGPGASRPLALVAAAVAFSGVAVLALGIELLALAVTLLRALVPAPELVRGIGDLELVDGRPTRLVHELDRGERDVAVAVLSRRVRAVRR